MPRTAAESTENKAVETEKEDLVTIKLPISRDRQDDVFVAVNGQTWLLQRGVEIEVPRVVKEVLDNTERMDNLALERQREMVRRSK